MSQQNWDTRPDPADWSQSQNLHSTVLLDSCYHQCQMSRCVSMQLLLLLRWKVRPLMHYQAINSVTEARSSIRTCFKRSVTKHVLCREQTAFLPVDLDIRAPLLHMPMTLCAFSIFTHENQLLHGCLLCCFSSHTALRELFASYYASVGLSTVMTGCTLLFSKVQMDTAEHKL